jgi:hypothetical protein
MQHMKRRLRIIVLLAKDLLAQLKAFFHQCKGLLVAGLGPQRKSKIVHTTQRGRMLVAKHSLPRLHHLHKQLFSLFLSPLVPIRRR